MAGVEDMIDQMERWLGTGEPNAIQEWYRKRNGSAFNYNFPWCNAAITRAAYDSGNYDAVCFGTDYAYTVAHAARFRTAGRWHYGASGIRRGDIVFFDWGGTNELGRIDHVGIVTSVSGGAVYTIEGNIGDVCARKVRYESTIAGYGRPDYTGSGGSGVPRYQVTINGLRYGYGAKGSHVTAVGRALVKHGCSAYQEGPGPNWTDADTRSYAKWQRKLGYSGSDADGVPGATSLRKLMGKLPGKPAPKRPVVDLSSLVRAARTNPSANGQPVTYSGVKVVEKALVAEGLLSSRYADGHFGTTTVAAYAKWQRRLGYRGRDADGIPGMTSLKKLGAKHGFSVRA